MSPWQDISTAPKANLASQGFDALVGPRIVISDGEREAVAFWCEEMEDDDGDGGTQITPEGWLDFNECEMIKWEPTRWKPGAP